MAEHEPITDDGFYSNFNCRASYHITQLKGDGSTVAFLLYDQCCALGHETNKAFPSLRALAPFLHCHESKLYAAAKLLCAAGWLVELSSKQGSPTTYRGVDHDNEWAPSHAGACALKLEPDYWHRDPVALAFYGATGGCKVPGENILKGWLRLCDGNPALLIELAKAYTDANPLPKHFNQRPTWRAAFGSYLKGFRRAQPVR
jgi:hypothetical protein